MAYLVASYTALSKPALSPSHLLHIRQFGFHRFRHNRHSLTVLAALHTSEY